MLTTKSLTVFQRSIAEAGVDGWLLYDFRGCNPIAWAVAGVGGHITRRFFVWIPRDGSPTAITHAIEQGVWNAWPTDFKRVVYSSWGALERSLAELVGGKRIAMEYSPGDAVPYVDRVPAGVLEMVRAAGADVVSSGDLVTRFYALWTPDELAAHRRAAEHVATIARDALEWAGMQAQAGRATTEHVVQARILEAFERAGLETDSPPNVSVGANAANPHYVPQPSNPQLITTGNVLLIDLWATERGGIYADQTWMAMIGTPSSRAMEVWTAVRDARDAAIDLGRRKVAEHAPVRGADLDDAARGVISSRGYGANFTHRTGHSIDARELHGSGPNLDNLETREERLLIPGVGFSIEPGIYLPGEFGMRTEVNAFFGDGELIVTPREYQTALLVV